MKLKRETENMPASIAAEVAALTAVIERMEKRAEEDRQERKAAQAETESTRRATSAELTDIRHGQTDMLRRLDSIEPVTALVTSWRGKLAGVMIVMGFIGALATFVVAFFKDIIVGSFQ